MNTMPKTKIVYTKQKSTRRPTFCSQKFGNLLAYTFQGVVDQSSDGTWDGWMMNLSRKHDSDFRLGFKSRAAAARWTNDKLRERGI